MIDKLSLSILEFIKGTEKALKVFCAEKLGDQVLAELHALLERGVSVEFIFANQLVEDSENSPFYLYKVLSIGNSGAQIYSVSEFKAQGDYILQRDFSEILAIELSKDTAEVLDSWDSRFDQFDQAFEQNSLLNSEFRQGSTDLEVRFWAENRISLKDSQTKIFWEVRNAELIEIDQIGEVESSGEASQTITSNRIITLYASSSNQRKFKSIYIPVVELPSIFYNVQFLNPTSQSFVSLPEDSGTGVFGVSAGHRICLTWQVKNAENVVVDPIGVVEHTGSYECVPNGKIEFTIRASLQEAEVVSRIIVQEFPVPVFQEKFIEIDPIYFADEVFKVKDKRQDAIEYLSSKSNLNDLNASSLWEKTADRERELRRILMESTFDEFFKKYNITKVNQTIGERIKSYFRNEPSVLEMIKSMQEYYD